MGEEANERNIDLKPLCEELRLKMFSLEQKLTALVEQVEEANRTLALHYVEVLRTTGSLEIQCQDLEKQLREHDNDVALQEEAVLPKQPPQILVRTAPSTIKLAEGGLKPTGELFRLIMNPIAPIWTGVHYILPHIRRLLQTSGSWKQA